MMKEPEKDLLFLCEDFQPRIKGIVTVFQKESPFPTKHIHFWALKYMPNEKNKNLNYFKFFPLHLNI